MSYLSTLALIAIVGVATANPQFRFNNNNGFFNRPAARPNQAPRGGAGGNCNPTINYQSGMNKIFVPFDFNFLSVLLKSSLNLETERFAAHQVSRIRDF
jgi:hypothetical protein